MKTTSIIGAALVLSVLILVVQGLELAFPSWIEQGKGSRYWSGSLLSKSSTFYTNFSCKKLETSFCEGLMNLWRSGLILLSFELFSISANLALAYQLLRLIANLKVDSQVLVGLSACAGVSHLVGFLVWSVFVKLRYGEGDCLEDFINSEEAAVCATGGPMLAIAAVALYLVQGFAVGAVALKLRKMNENADQEKKSENSKIVIKSESVVNV